MTLLTTMLSVFRRTVPQFSPFNRRIPALCIWDQLGMQQQWRTSDTGFRVLVASSTHHMKIPNLKHESGGDGVQYESFAVQTRGQGLFCHEEHVVCQAHEEQETG